VTDSQCVDLLRSLRRTAIIVGLACSAGSILAATAIALWVSAHNRAELMRMMQSIKCNCQQAVPHQVNDQRVILAAPVTREDLVREELKALHETRKHDNVQ
jgi:hypothetical protein